MTGSKLKLFVIVESVLGHGFVALLTLGLLRIEYRRLDVSESSRILTNLADIITTKMGLFMFLVVLITLIYCLIRLVQTSRRKGWAELDALDWYFIFRPRSINVATLHFKLNGEELSRDEYVSLGYHHPMWSMALIDFWKRNSAFGVFMPSGEPRTCPSCISMAREFLRFIIINNARSIANFIVFMAFVGVIGILVTGVVYGRFIGDPDSDLPPFPFIGENFVVLFQSTSIWELLLLVNIITIVIKTVKSSSPYAVSSAWLTSNASDPIIDEKLVPGMFRHSVMKIRDSMRFKLDKGYYSQEISDNEELSLKKFYKLYSSGSTSRDLTLRLTGPSVAEQFRGQKKDFIPIENALFSKGHAYYLPPFSTLPFASFQSTELRNDHLGVSTVHFIDIKNGQLVIEFADKRLVVNISSSNYGRSEGVLVDRDSSIDRLSPSGSPESSEEDNKVKKSVVEGANNGEWPSEEEMNRQYKEAAKGISARIDAIFSAEELMIWDKCLVWMVVNWKDVYQLRLSIEQVETNTYSAFFVLGQKAVTK